MLPPQRTLPYTATPELNLPGLNAMERLTWLNLAGNQQTFKTMADLHLAWFSPLYSVEQILSYVKINGVRAIMIALDLFIYSVVTCSF